MKKLIVKIGLDGKPEIDAQGFMGGTCKDASRAFEQKFAGAGMNVVEKPEMAMMDVEAEQQMEMTL